MPASVITSFLLVRHGQTEWNRVERFRGRADVPLNETGLIQAAATGRRIAAGWQPAAVYASPLSRAIVTGQAIAARFDLPVLPLDGLADIRYGDWQGLTPEQARARWPDLVHAWYAAPATVQIPGGESLADLREARHGRNPRAGSPPRRSDDRTGQPYGRQSGDPAGDPGPGQ